MNESIQAVLGTIRTNGWYGRYEDGSPIPRCPSCGATLVMRNGVRICMYCNPDRWHMNVHDVDEITEE